VFLCVFLCVSCLCLCVSLCVSVSLCLCVSVCAFCAAGQGDRKCKGVIDLDPGTTVEDTPSAGKANCFSVITPSRRFVLRAKDVEELEVWKSAITENAVNC
jgi:hypothetical protein